MQFKKKHVRRMSMDITPLIDVVFLLLIFLLLSTTFISSPGIHINLPSAAIKQKSDKQKSLEISITKIRNQIYSTKINKSFLALL